MAEPLVNTNLEHRGENANLGGYGYFCPPDYLVLAVGSNDAMPESMLFEPRFPAQLRLPSPLARKFGLD